jgi:hypothetical protein
MTTQLPDYRRGDTWDGMTIVPTFVLGNPPEPVDPPGDIVSARCQFRAVGSGKVIAEPTVEITDAENWEMVVQPQILTPNYAGSCDWDVEVSYLHNDAQKVLTIASGIIAILPDVTR